MPGPGSWRLVHRGPQTAVSPRTVLQCPDHNLWASGRAGKTRDDSQCGGGAGGLEVPVPPGFCETCLPSGRLNNFSRPQSRFTINQRQTNREPSIRSDANSVSAPGGPETPGQSARPWCHLEKCLARGAAVVTWPGACARVGGGGTLKRENTLHFLKMPMAFWDLQNRSVLLEGCVVVDYYLRQITHPELPKG